MSLGLFPQLLMLASLSSSQRERRMKVTRFLLSARMCQAPARGCFEEVKVSAVKVDH